MESTVTTKPRHGTVDSFAGILRECARGRYDNIDAALTGIIVSIVEGELTTDAEARQHVINALAAAGLVRAELQAARR